MATQARINRRRIEKRHGMTDHKFRSFRYYKHTKGLSTEDAIRMIGDKKGQPFIHREGV